MRKIGFICAIILFAGSLLYGQTMVGLSKDEVKGIVKTDHKEFRRDDSVIKQRFNYLKYVNGPRTKTWIIYFDDQDICRTSKVVCDYSDYNKMLEDINSKYRQTGELIWEFQVDSDTILVELIKLEWYFTIRETSKKQGRD
ncbi:MAG: hypothetical protein GY790_10010 [Bacteroidetes bacterium]|nr:hypothetical protein [Bacteroidota bacterium]